MFNYKSQICDVCGKEFTEEDDIVVCPICGTPHHRECWIKNGNCVNSDKHAEGFEWKALQIVGAPAVDGEKRCPHCGAATVEGARFCENCGRPLDTGTAPVPYREESESHTNTGNGPFNTSFEDFSQRIEREMSGEIEGVKVKDIYAYIGPNAQYFVFKFRRMMENSKYHPFDFTAFLFRPLWYIYRKMWQIGILAGVINLILNTPAVILTFIEAGFISASSALAFPGIENVATICYFLDMAVNIMWGLLAVPMYKKHVIGTLKKMRSESMDDITYYQKIQRKAGPSRVGMVLIGFFALMYILSLFINI